MRNLFVESCSVTQFWCMNEWRYLTCPVMPVMTATFLSCCSPFIVELTLAGSEHCAISNSLEVWIELTKPSDRIDKKRLCVCLQRDCYQRASSASVNRTTLRLQAKIRMRKRRRNQPMRSEHVAADKKESVKRARCVWGLQGGGYSDTCMLAEELQLFSVG